MALDHERVKELETALGCRLADTTLLEQAFVHPSLDTAGSANYQRLEFLGDEVAGLAVSILLYRRFPDAEEGQLSRARAYLTNEGSFADIARTLGLGDLLILGKGEEKTAGREKDSILADVFESLMAVIFLSSGWDTALKVAERIFIPRFGAAADVEGLLRHIDQDHKSHLQELAQMTGQQLPSYTLAGKEGPDHESLFTVECRALGLTATGTGRNRKAAEQEAARRLLDLLKEEDR